MQVSFIIQLIHFATASGKIQNQFFTLSSCFMSHFKIIFSVSTNENHYIIVESLFIHKFSVCGGAISQSYLKQMLFTCVQLKFHLWNVLWVLLITKNLLDLNAKIIICLHFNEDFPINLRFSMEKAVLYKRSMLLYG